MKRFYFLMAMGAFLQVCPVGGISRYLLLILEQKPKNMVKDLITRRNQYEALGDAKSLREAAFIDSRFKNTHIPVMDAFVAARLGCYGGLLAQYDAQVAIRYLNTTIGCTDQLVLNKAGRCKSASSCNAFGADRALKHSYQDVDLAQLSVGQSEAKMRSFADDVVRKCPQCMSNIHAKKK